MTIFDLMYKAFPDSFHFYAILTIFAILCMVAVVAAQVYRSRPMKNKGRHVMEDMPGRSFRSEAREFKKRMPLFQETQALPVIPETTR